MASGSAWGGCLTSDIIPCLQGDHDLVGETENYMHSYSVCEGYYTRSVSQILSIRQNSRKGPSLWIRLIGEALILL